jgi:hypothetical protein
VYITIMNPKGFPEIFMRVRVIPQRKMFCEGKFLIMNNNIDLVSVTNITYYADPIPKITHVMCSST